MNNSEMINVQVIIIASIVIGIIALLLLYYFLILQFSLQALVSGLEVTPIKVLVMRMRKSPVKVIITELVRAKKAGIIVDINDFESFALTGGDLKNVVNGLIYAKARNIDLTFKEACHLDIQKKDIELYLMNK